MHLRLFDCEDSFSWNLVELFRRQGAEVEVLSARRPLARLPAGRPDACVLSPGPGRPRHWPRLFELLERLDPGIPVLGVCLGHQVLGEFHGARLRRETPVHGEAVPLRRPAGRLLGGLPEGSPVMRYNSLGLDPERRPAGLVWTGFGPAGELLALEHRDLPQFGLQFHPDSLLTPAGAVMARRFLEIARGNRAGKGPGHGLDSEASCAHSSVG